MLSPKKFPHLSRALDLEPTAPGHGLCFHRAVALVLDEPRARIAIGTLKAATPEQLAKDPDLSTVPFVHCWTELGSDTVVAPTTYEAAGKRLYAMPKAAYYEINAVRDVYYLSRAQVLRLAREHGWSNYIRKAKPSRLPKPLGATLLEAAGVPHTVCDEGGVIPS